MDYQRTGEIITASIKAKPSDFVAYTDLTDLLISWSKEDDILPYEKAGNVLNIQNFGLQRAVEAQNYEEAEKYRQLIFRTLLFSAPRNFDHYMQALEYDRDPSQRFYIPRRTVLLGHVKALQELYEGEIDELFLSQPPRTGKSTLVTMFYTWAFGRNSEASNLYCSVTDDLTKSFYNGVLEVITDPDTYNWGVIFPSAKMVSKNSDKETINIDREKKYPSLTCRALYGSLNGSCDCNGVLCADDLLSGIEEARNPSRLETAWTTVDNNLLSRAKESARILWIGTRWSLNDPIGRRKRALESDEKFKNRKFKDISIPALNEKDESNFDYKYGVGFSTSFYQQRRASFEANNDMASWDAQYQNAPIERNGAVFTPDTMRYYNGQLPDEEPLRIWAICDPAFGGGDFVSMPVIVSYNRLDNYVVDAVFNNGDKSVTLPLVAKKLSKHNVGSIDLEVSKSTRPYAEGVEKECNKIGYHCTITTHTAPQNVAKEYRIFDKAPDIRQYFIFRDAGHRSKEYSMFMQNIFSFTVEGKNKHDDAPDSMAMAADKLFKHGSAKIEIIQRPF
ncbi:phage terminase large subunit [bacterium]|nr:phage terminase large subunit [bacterium]